MKGIFEVFFFIALLVLLMDPKEFGSTIGKTFHQIETGFSEGYQP